jgi:hypothetical protein
MLLGSISSLLLAFSNHTAFLYPWSDYRVWGLLLSFGILLCLFIAFEGWFAKRPIVPLSLFTGQTLPCIFASNFTLSVAAQTFVRSSHVPPQNALADLKRSLCHDSYSICKWMCRCARHIESRLMNLRASTKPCLLYVCSGFDICDCWGAFTAKQHRISNRINISGPHHQKDGKVHSLIGSWTGDANPIYLFRLKMDKGHPRMGLLGCRLPCGIGLQVGSRSTGRPSQEND